MSFGIRDHRNSSNYSASLPNYKMSGRSAQKYPFKGGKGSVIQMELNLKRRELIFHVDGKSSGVAYADIPCGDTVYYRMFIAFQFKDSATRLLYYTETL